jgi:hypothetical protein
MTSGVVTRNPAVNVVSRDLGAAAVHHHRPQPCVPQEHHVLGERGAQRAVGHSVAAVLDHDRLPVEPVQPRQRLDQHPGLGQRVRWHTGGLCPRGGLWERACRHVE